LLTLYNAWKEYKKSFDRTMMDSYRTVTEEDLLFSKMLVLVPDLVGQKHPHMPACTECGAGYYFKCSPTPGKVKDDGVGVVIGFFHGFAPTKNPEGCKVHHTSDHG
jgi:hypothetical protein